MKHFRLLLPVLSGLALSVSFPNFSVYFLAWLALIPFLYFCLTESSKWKLAFAHIAFSFFYFGGVLYWIPRVLIIYGGLGIPEAVILFIVMLFTLSFFLAPFTALVWWTKQNKGPISALLSAPAFWVLTEVARNYLAVGGFPWASLAYSQVPFQVVIQCVDIGGVYLLSFLIVLVNACFLALIWKQSFRFGVGVLGLFFLINLYGIYRIHGWTIPLDGTLRAGLLQGNIALAGTREYYAKKYYETLAKLYDQAAGSGSALVIIPEAQNPFFYSEDFYFRTFWGNKAKDSGSFILLNSAAFDQENRSIYYNSAYLIAPNGESTYRYDKNHLVPFGEYLPLQSILGKFAEPLVREVSSFSPGKDLSPGLLGEVLFGTLICYEGIFPEISREFVQKGSQILINITNDAWFGDTAAPEQHLQMAALRAVEFRRPLLRAANSGITTTVTPFGRIQNRTELFTETAVVADISYSSYRTIYSYLGDWLVISLIIVSTIAVNWDYFSKLKEKIRARGLGNQV
jgi:apolipoprotein N-acyltransferase